MMTLCLDYIGLLSAKLFTIFIGQTTGFSKANEIYETKAFNTHFVSVFAA